MFSLSLDYPVCFFVNTLAGPHGNNLYYFVFQGFIDNPEVSGAKTR